MHSVQSKPPLPCAGPPEKEDDKMEAVLGLFLIVMLFALLSGASRSGAESDRPVTRIEIAPTGSARTTSSTSTASEGGMGSIIPALILLLTVLALMYNAG